MENYSDNPLKNTINQTGKFTDIGEMLLNLIHPILVDCYSVSCITRTFIPLENRIKKLLKIKFYQIENKYISEDDIKGTIVNGISNDLYSDILNQVVVNYNKIRDLLYKHFKDHKKEIYKSITPTGNLLEYDNDDFEIYLLVYFLKGNCCNVDLANQNYNMEDKFLLDQLSFSPIIPDVENIVKKTINNKYEEQYLFLGLAIYREFIISHMPFYYKLIFFIKSPFYKLVKKLYTKWYVNYLENKREKYAKK